MKTNYKASLAMMMSIFLTGAHLFAAPGELKLEKRPTSKPRTNEFSLRPSERNSDSDSKPQSLRTNESRSSSKDSLSSNSTDSRPSDQRMQKLTDDGSSSGGGNDKVVTPDGRPELASLYATLPEDFNLADHIPPGKKYQIPENVKKELQKLQRILHSTLVQSNTHNYDAFGKSFINEDDFIATEILSEGVELLLVPEIPDGSKDPIFSQCLNVTRNAQLPAHATRSRSACTLYSTPFTLMVENDFQPPQDGSAELRFQALSLAHEGLRRRGIPDADVSRIDQSLAMALDLLNAQTAGQLRDISAEEESKIRWLLRLSFQYSLGSKSQPRFPKWLNDIKVWKKGGGFVRTSLVQNPPPDYQQDGVEPTAFIGMATAVVDTYIPGNVVLIDTNICQTQGCQIQTGARIIRTYIDMKSQEQGALIRQNAARIGERALLENVTATEVTSFQVGPASRVVDFHMKQGRVLIGGATHVRNVSLGYTAGRQAAEGVHLLQYYELKLMEGARLENLSLLAGIPIRLDHHSQVGASTSTKLWVLRSEQGLLQNEKSIGLTFTEGSRTDLTGFSQSCKPQSNAIVVEAFKASVGSLPELQKLCRTKPLWP